MKRRVVLLLLAAVAIAVSVDFVGEGRAADSAESSADLALGGPSVQALPADALPVDARPVAAVAPVRPIPRRWEGSWSSSLAGLFHGTLQTELPDPFPVGESFSCTATVRYAEDSLYHPGKYDIYRVEGRYDPEAKADATLVLTAAKGDQVLTFTGRLSAAGDTIEGRYSSKGPFDRGSFEARREP